jgi:hypothetical protein
LVCQDRKVFLERKEKPVLPVFPVCLQWYRRRVKKQRRDLPANQDLLAPTATKANEAFPDSQDRQDL